MTESTLDAVPAGVADENRTERHPLALDRLAVECVARCWTMRTEGPPVSVRAYRDTGGLVVVLKVRTPGWPLSGEWAATVAAVVELESGGELRCGGLTFDDERGLIVFGFKGELAADRWTDRPGWQATARRTRSQLRRPYREAVAA